MRHLGLCVATLLFALVTFHAEAARSKKLQTPAGKSEPGAVAPMKPVKAEAITPYNKGVDLLEAKDYAKAREQFEAALKASEEFPEAHNNLAFALRMLSPDNAEASLSHYKRALELEPKFAQALYYRGILFVQLDRAADAEKDRAALAAIASDESKTYAAELAKIIKAGKATKKQDALSVYGNLAQ